MSTSDTVKRFSTMTQESGEEGAGEEEKDAR